MSGYMVDLDISPYSAIKGGIQVFLNWYDRDKNGQTEPAFWFRKASGSYFLYALPMSSIHHVMRADGYALLSIVSLGAEIAAALGFDRMDRQAAKNVADLILENTDDLYQMPPSPPSSYELEQAAIRKAELVLKIEGNTVFHDEIAVGA